MRGAPTPILIAGCLLGGTPALAQDFVVDAHAMARAVLDTRQYTVLVRVEVTDSMNRSVVTNRIRATRDGDRFLYELDSMSILVTPSATIQIDHSRRTIAYSRNDVGYSTAFTNLPNPDSLKMRSDSVVAIEVSSASRRYALFSRRGPISRTEIAFNIPSRLPTEVKYRYSMIAGESADVVIRYDWDLGASADSRALAVESYVTITNNDIQPAPRLIGYEVAKPSRDD